MTAQASTAKKNPFWVNFCNRVKANKRSAIILTILHIISAPLILINGIIYDYTYEKYQRAMEAMRLTMGTIDYDKLPGYYDFNEMYVVIAVLATAIAALTGIVIAMNSFSYLYKKTQVDMIYSLPLTTKERFLSDFLAGAATYLVPFLTSSVVTFICCIIGSFVAPNWKSTEVVSFGFQSVGQVIFQLSVYGFFLMLMIYVLTVLVVTCCGNILESVLYTFIANGLIPATIAVLGFLVLGYDLYGVEIESSVIPWIERTSPFGGIIGIIDSLESFTNLGTIFIHWLLPFIVFTAIYFGLSMFLYCRRKAEDVSRPFVFRMFYHIMITAFTFCLASLFISEDSYDMLVPLIITGAIFYFIMDIIVNRGFKKFWMTVIRYIVTITVLIIAIFVTQATDGLGMVYHIPPESAVKSVSIDYAGQFSQNSTTHYYYSFTGSYAEGYELSDKESIRTVMDVHEVLIEEYKAKKDTEPHFMYRDGPYVYFTYNYHTGQKVTRRYTLTREQYAMLAPIDLTDEYIEQTVERARKEVLEDLQNHIMYGNDSDAHLITIQTMAFENSHPIVTSTNPDAYLLINEFFDAYKADLLAMTEEEYFDTDSRHLCRVHSSSAFDVFLDENYKNTVAFIKENSQRSLNDEVTNPSRCAEALSRIYEVSYDDLNNSDYSEYYLYIDPEMISNEDAVTIYENLIPLSKMRISDIPEKETYYLVRCLDGLTYYVPERADKSAERIFNDMKAAHPSSGEIYLNDGNVVYFASYDMAVGMMEYIYENYPATGIFAESIRTYDTSIFVYDRHFSSPYFSEKLWRLMTEMNDMYEVYEHVDDYDITYSDYYYDEYAYDYNY